MRVVFMGTPAFAVPSLDALAEQHEVVLAVTRQDRASGRGGSPRPSAVKQAALGLGIKVEQPPSLAGDGAVPVRHMHPDVICVAAFGMLLPPEVLSIPRYGCINVHASLLPRYRGAAPVQRAILAGETETGVSIMRMEEGLDTGPYALQAVVPIGDRYAAEVETDLAHAGARALLDVLAHLESGIARWVEQDASRVSYAAKITKDDVALTPEIDAAEAYRRVRAATGRAPARACLGDREVTVVRAHPSPAELIPGAVCFANGTPVLGFAEGALALDVVRPAGRGDMPGVDWARGARLDDNVCWRCTR